MKLHDTWQDTLHINMDSLLIGTDWHEVEKQNNVYFRWTGPEPLSTIHINPRRDVNNRLNITIQAASSKEILTGLQLKADDIPLQTTLSNKYDPTYITAILPVDTSKRAGSKTVLTLLLPNTLSESKIYPDNSGNRLLGIAISKINIFPLSRSLFTAQKYNDPDLFDGIHYTRHNPAVRDAVIQGVYSSAYEYFLKHDRTGAKNSFELHENFDECPGDLYDILKADMQEQSLKLEKKYQKEINELRRTIYLQGDTILALKGEGKISI